MNITTPPKAKAPPEGDFAANPFMLKSPYRGFRGRVDYEC